MPSSQNRATGTRSVNPVLYTAVTGDITWDRWSQARMQHPDLDVIEDLAFQIYADIPSQDKRHPGRVRRETNGAMASEAMTKLLETFRSLPSELFPTRRLTPLFGINFVLKLVPRMHTPLSH